MLRDGVFEMVDAGEFPKDSLSCEWAYIINLDDATLEVCKGFNRDKDAQHPRYAVDTVEDVFGETYYAVRLLTAIRLTFSQEKEVPDEQAADAAGTHEQG